MADPLNRLNAALSGRYRVERQLGEGGMATVYLAEDLKHRRRVALKVLKPELAAVVGAERFLAEIETTANLQHPHILPLFDSGEADGLLFYVMPRVEGESLRERLDREHQLPVDEAVRIATNVAEALDYAHRHGVIHRDIKPANILLLDGKPVVSDFGIALAVSSGSAGRMTETGLSLGTPHYMSPEQATGDQSVGPATDIWALGCVLYEILVGEPPYTGGTPQAVLGKIITAEPPSAIEARKSVPPNVDAAIRKALEKVPADRFGSAGELVKALTDGGFDHGPRSPVLGKPMDRSRQALAVGLAVVVVVLVSGVLWAFQSDAEAPSLTTRASVRFRAGQDLTDKGQLAISADGSLIVYEGVAEGVDNTRLWARPIDALEAVPVPGTERRRTVGPDQSISPDGREVVVRDEQAIRVFPLFGGVPRTLVDDPAASRPDWSPDGRWIYFTDASGGISRVSPRGGGEPEVVTVSAGAPHHFIDLLPDGQSALVEIRPRRIGVVDIETGNVRDIGPGEFPRYAGGYLFYQAGELGTTLLASPFNANRGELTGPPVTIAEGLPRTSAGNQRYAVSTTGTLLYEVGSSIDGRPVIVDRQGTAVPIDTTLIGDYGGPVLSPEATRLAMYSAEGVWVYNLRSRVPTRIADLTLPPGQAATPSWSPDGRAVVFVSQNIIYSQRADGASEPQALLSRRVDGLNASWSPAGDALILVTPFPPGRDIVALQTGDTIPVPVIATAAEEFHPILSPSGEWLAYASSEFNRPEVFLRRFGDANQERIQISTEGGQFPLWSPSGSEIFYSDLSREFISVRLGPDMEIAERRRLFSRQAYSSISDVMPDGDSFLASLRPGGDVDELVIVLNVFEELDRRTSN